MEKIIQEEIKEHYCDNCICNMEYLTVELEFSYGSSLDGKRFTFCSDKCLKEFVNKNNLRLRVSLADWWVVKK